MRCLDLTARNIIMLFPLQGSYLSLCQDNAFTGYLGLQVLEPIFKTGQVMAQPDAADTAGRDEGTEFAQLVTGPRLTVDRKIKACTPPASTASL